MHSPFQYRNFKVRAQSISMLGEELGSHFEGEVTTGRIGYEYDAGNEQMPLMVLLRGGLWGD